MTSYQDVQWQLQLQSTNSTSNLSHINRPSASNRNEVSRVSATIGRSANPKAPNQYRDPSQIMQTCSPRQSLVQAPQVARILGQTQSTAPLKSPVPRHYLEQGIHHHNLHCLRSRGRQNHCRQATPQLGSHYLCHHHRCCQPSHVME